MVEALHRRSMKSLAMESRSGAAVVAVVGLHLWSKRFSQLTLERMRKNMWSFEIPSGFTHYGTLAAKEHEGTLVTLI